MPFCEQTPFEVTNCDDPNCRICYSDDITDYDPPDDSKTQNEIDQEAFIR